MLNLDIKYISAKNFMCFGEDGIEIDFSKYQNIVLVNGVNVDRKKNDSRSSNGIGKSTIPEILVYAIYGETIKEKLNTDSIINNKIKKGLVVEARLGNFRIVRTRKPNTLKFWEGDVEYDLGIPATQQLILDKIKINKQSFVNLVVFRDDNNNSFLESDAKTKREIVENLLSLGTYRELSDKTKTLKKECLDRVKFIVQEYQLHLQELGICRTRLDKIKQQEQVWISQKEATISAMKLSMEEKVRKMDSLDANKEISSYNESKDRLSVIVNEIPSLQGKVDKIQSRLQEEKIKYLEENSVVVDLELSVKALRATVQEINRNIESSNKTIAAFSGKISGEKCPSCFGTVDEKNYSDVLEHCRETVEAHNLNISLKKEEVESKEKNISERKEIAAKHQSNIKMAEGLLQQMNGDIMKKQSEINQLSKLKKPEMGADLSILQSQIEDIKIKISETEKELRASPYKEVIISSLEEIEIKTKICDTKKIEAEEAEKKLPYYEFWNKAFGDNGIRKFIIDGIIPTLNNRISYWLQHLIDGKIKLTFNNQLEELIERNDDSSDVFVYNGMSGGEKRRLNLAVSQAFAHIMMVSTGTIPSVLFLDEVSTNLDQNGVLCVYQMICELSKTKQVFVTTHDSELLELLSGHKNINLKMENGFSKLV